MTDPSKKETPEQKPNEEDLELPTPHARVTVEKSDWKTQVEVPDKQAGKLLDVLGGATAATAAAVGPSLTLSALPAGFPAWMAFTVVIVQLAVSVPVVWLVRQKRVTASR